MVELSMPRLDDTAWSRLPWRLPPPPPPGPPALRALLPLPLPAPPPPLPQIPEALRRRDVEVVALALFRVAIDGSATVELVQPTFDTGLNRALLDTLKTWRFFPALDNGRPVASTVQIRIPISVR